MIFQADYWLATEPNEKIELIQQFVCDDYLYTMVIISKMDFDVQQIVKDLEIMDDLFCKVIIHSDTSSISFNADEDSKTKVIYLCKDLDTATIHIKTHMPLVAFFE